MKILTLSGSIALFASFTLADSPRGTIPLDAPPSQWPMNYRLHLEGAADARLADDLKIPLGEIQSDQRTVILDIPDLARTRCYELKINDRILHGTIHQLNQD